jgi:antitoxin HicB
VLTDLSFPACLVAGWKPARALRALRQIKRDREVSRPEAEEAQRTPAGHRAMTNPHIGSSFDDFLKEEGLYEEATTRAVKRVIAWQIAQAMAEQHISKTEMARRMQTSRAQLERLLDPDNDKVQLDTMQRAAAAVGRKLRLELA